MIHDGWGSKTSGITLDPLHCPDYRNGLAMHSSSPLPVSPQVANLAAGATLINIRGAKLTHG